MFNHCKAVTYIFAYFSKAEGETSEEMKQAARDTIAGNKSDHELILQRGKALLKRQYIL